MHRDFTNIDGMKSGDTVVLLEGFDWPDPGPINGSWAGVTVEIWTTSNSGFYSYPLKKYCKGKNLWVAWRECILIPHQRIL